MKCCSRSTLGVVIGALNIVFYIAASIYLIFLIIDINGNANNNNNEEYRSRETSILATLLVVLLIMMIISGLLVMGIIKRCHKLMLPWLILSGIGFVLNILRSLMSLFVMISQGFGPFLIALFLCVLIIGLQGLILWAIYTLYRDIQMKSDGKNGRVIGGPEVSLAPQPIPYSSQPNYYKQLD